jgi:hypothetical protein
MGRAAALRRPPSLGKQIALSVRYAGTADISSRRKITTAAGCFLSPRLALFATTLMIAFNVPILSCA